MPNKSPLEGDAASVKVGFWPNKEPIVGVFFVAEPNRDPVDLAGKPNAVVDLEDDIELGDDSLTAPSSGIGSSSSFTILLLAFFVKDVRPEPLIPLQLLHFGFDAVAKRSNKVITDTD